MKLWLKKHPYLLFIAPGFIIYTVFIVFPIFSAFFNSLNSWSGIGPKTFVGFSNYIELFTNKRLYMQLINALKNNLIIFALNGSIVLILQLFIAYTIFNKVKGYRYIQVMVFAPQFIASTILVFLGTLMLDANIGVFNKLLECIGLGEYVKPWMGMPQYGIFIVWLIGAWAGIGVGMLFLVGAMKMIPNDTVEAALIDGASYWKRFFYIILPQIKVTVFNLLILSYIFSMTVFDYNYLIGGTAGGVNNSVDVMSLFFYRVAFGSGGQVGGTISQNAMGMGTTIACVMFGLILIVALIQLNFSYKNVEEDN